MTRDQLNDEYFEWMCHLINDKKITRGLSYRRLLMKLHSLAFIFTIDRDENRATDGIDLRYRFGYDNNYPKSMTDDYLNRNYCSILEMMIALSMRCEENIMYDEEYGNRMPVWFWEMIFSLGLDNMDDEHYEPRYVEEVITRFNDRNYAPDGFGGLFTIKDCNKDLRNVEIWYQMCWYLNSITN